MILWPPEFGANTRVSLNRLCGEPVVCTPDSYGFRHFCISASPALNPLFVAVWLVFVVSVVFVKGGSHANHRFGKPVSLEPPPKHGGIACMCIFRQMLGELGKFLPEAAALACGVAAKACSIGVGWGERGDCGSDDFMFLLWGCGKVW